MLVIAAEYGTGTIRATFVANPRRWTVLTAKTTVVFGVVLAVGLVATLASFFVGEAILRGNGFVYANGYPAASWATDPRCARSSGPLPTSARWLCSEPASLRSCAVPREP